MGQQGGLDAFKALDEKVKHAVDPSSLNPKPYILNPYPRTLNPEP